MLHIFNRIYSADNTVVYFAIAHTTSCSFPYWPAIKLYSTYSTIQEGKFELKKLFVL